MPIPQVTLDGIEEVQRRNQRRIAAMEPGGVAEEAVRDAVVSLHKYAVNITHIGKYEGGGALRAAYRMEVDGLEGKVYIDPGASSPRGKTRPREYGVYENARGGEHAFYDRTVAEEGPSVTAEARQKITEAVLYAQ
jgi:hypothetical protein